ncbi:zonular occludens toxin [Ectopseudomonas mendocina]|nr:zonular occludens toxin [Pseudomonas mendocina]
MLIIRTGKPGHGKTLNTIREVDQKAHAEGRVVYYHNINGLKPETLQAQWFEFEDPEKWYELPNDSIVVIDEAQGWFGARDPRARPPEHITRFETMRHQGHEVHLVTQDPRYLDVHLRRLCNSHIHYWRVFKSSQLLRFESEVVVEKVEVKTSFKDADKKTLRLDKRYFGSYTSTNAKHHFQAKVPTKFLMAIAVIAIAGIMVFRVYERYQSGKESAAVEPSAPNASMVDQVKNTVGAFIKPLGDSGERKGPQTKADYLDQRVPRVADLPASAPIYDDLTKPKTFPRLYCLASHDPDIYARKFARTPSAMVNGKPTVCQCYTQQGTKVQTEFRFCLNIVENGYFDPAIPDRTQPEYGQGTAAQSSSPPPAQTSSQPQPNNGVTIVTYEKGRFLW